jgi:hypothetical protein
MDFAIAGSVKPILEVVIPDIYTYKLPVLCKAFFVILYDRLYSTLVM